MGRAALVCFGSAFAGPAAAHDPGLSSLDLTPTSSGIQARLSLSPRDAELAARIDADGKLTADEWTIAVPRLEAFARETIDVRIGDRRLTGSIDDVGLEGDARSVPAADGLRHCRSA